MSKTFLRQQARHDQLLQAFHQYLPVARKIQGDLLTLLEGLAVEEAWSDEVVAGAKEWAGDIGVPWRALRRTRFKPDRVPPDLLEALKTRLSRSLHGKVPIIPPYNLPSHRLFTYVPPAELTDKLNRPVAIITLRLIKRDAKGTLDPLKEWAWWIAEMGRRTIRDWYGVDGVREEGVPADDGAEIGKAIVGGKRSLGGCVVIVDCKGTGLKNLEFDFLPYLVTINHNHFPGLFETVYVVNFSWAQSTMWTLAKRVLPESALEKIVFLGGKEVGEMFDLGRLPKAYGGRSDYDPFGPTDPIAENYALRTAAGPLRATSGPQSPKASPQTVAASLTTRQPSAVSIADVFYTPRTGNTPFHSWPATPRMTWIGGSSTSSRVDQRTIAMSIMEDKGDLPRMVRSLYLPDEGEEFFDAVEPSATPVLDRIESLTDFHLYLSPSRAANIELLLESDDEEDALLIGAERRSVLAGLPSSASQKHKRARSWGESTSILKAATAEERSYYNASLEEHHLHGLRVTLDRRGDELQPELQTLDTAPVDPDPSAYMPKVKSSHDVESHRSVTHTSARGWLPVAAFDTALNPTFGYPTIRRAPFQATTGSLKLKYGRKRKRDLVKTLLFLFLLRLVGFREWIDRICTQALDRAYRLIGLRHGHIPQHLTPDAAFRSNSTDLAVHPLAMHGNIFWTAMLLVIIRASWHKPLGTAMSRWRGIRRALSI